MRQYAGNWASAVWAFAPGAEAKLEQRHPRRRTNQVDQFAAFGYEPRVAPRSPCSRRSPGAPMHSQGRGLFSVLLKHLPDIDTRTVREAEFVCNSLIGFNFGDGHLHDEDLIAAVQREAGFEPGELVVVWVESQPGPARSSTTRSSTPRSASSSAAPGRWPTRSHEQPWLPNGPIPARRHLAAAGRPADVGTRRPPEPRRHRGHGALA